MDAKRSRDLLIVALIYAVTSLSGLWFMIRFTSGNPIWDLFYADVLMTLVVYLFSLILRNASMYDPYWSVIPILILLYWFTLGTPDVGFWPASILVLLWGSRLTWNWIRSWRGMDHQDWRYSDLREKSGPFYPLVNLFGIHLFPTLMVFLGSIPLFFLVSRPMTDSMWWLAGILVSISGIYLEWSADRTLYRFRKNAREGEICRTGLWRYSRHPNYLGEILFWWGLGLMGFGHGGSTWNFTGAIAMTFMFLIISLPMIEKRHQIRRKNYGAYMEEVPLLIPFTKRKSR